MASFSRIFFALALQLGVLSFAAVPARWEGVFSRANNAVQEGAWDEAQTQLELLKKELPEAPEVLELSALVYKAKNQLIDARNTYLQLYRNIDKWGTKSKRGLYAFELGNVAFQLKNKKRTEQFLYEAIDHDTNTEASHFLLGRLAFDHNELQKSRFHFERALKNPEFTSPSHWYLAKLSTQENQLSDAISSFVEAKESARAQLSRNSGVSESAKNLARQVLKNSDTELRAYDRSAWMAQVGIASSYDSNVLFVPNASDAAPDSNLGSFKQALNWRLRYASSPVRPFQYLGSYQGSVNYNFNQETKGGQFFTHDLSHFITKGFLKTWSYGIKLAGTGILQYQTDAYRPFSLTGAIGPFAKWKVGSNSALGAEAFFQPTKNYLDSSLPNNVHRSGWEQNVRLFWTSTVPGKYWMPSVFLTGTLMRPNGTEFRGSKLALESSNSMFLSQNFFLAQTLGLSGSWFTERESSRRSDTGISGALSAGYQFTEAFVLTAQLDYLKNYSSDASFRYDRLGANLSGSYSF